MKKVGICAIIKDCKESYLHDWIEWHKLIGVDYFFIYDNESKRPINSFLRQENVFVEVIKGEVKQLDAYNDCIFKQKNKYFPTCEWIAFIDDDEFIVPENGDIKLAMNDYKKFSGLGINWQVFGSSGEKYINDEKIFLKFNMSFDENAITDSEPSINLHIKSIVKPQDVSLFISPHFCAFETKWVRRIKKIISFGFRKYFFTKGLCVDVDCELINSEFTKSAKHSKIWLAHYYLKSEEEFRMKISRGRADTNVVEYQRTMESFYKLDEQCKIINNFVKEKYSELNTHK